MIAQYKTLKANSSTDIIYELEGTSYGPGSSFYPMYVQDHPNCAADGVSIVIQGGIGSTENATFTDSAGVNYTVSSSPVTHGVVNGLQMPILS